MAKNVLNGFWEFKITDNGIGIKSEYLEKIFVPFKRLHSYSEYPGTGIGLSVCKKIVNKFGGEIWAENYRVDDTVQGAIFKFTLPLNPPKEMT